MDKQAQELLGSHLELKNYTTDSPETRPLTALKLHLEPKNYTTDSPDTRPLTALKLHH
jgi:hypothetical protein